MNIVSQVAVAVIESHKLPGAEVHYFTDEAKARAEKKEPVMAAWLRGRGAAWHDVELALVAQSIINVGQGVGPHCPEAQLVSAVGTDRESVDVTEHITSWESPCV